MKWIAIISFLILSGCTNAIPEISVLRPPKVVVPVVQKEDYVETSNAAVASVSSATGYSAKVLVHGGTAAKATSSNDGYSLEIRHISF